MSVGVTKRYSIVKEQSYGIRILLFDALELFHHLIVRRGLVPLDALAAKRLVAILSVAGAVAGGGRL